MNDVGRGQYLFAVGGLVGAVAASSCCILPLVLFSLGVSGAWIGNLTQLAPYQPYFIAASLTAIGFGYWLVHRSSNGACVAERACASPRSNLVVKIGLVFATLLVIVAVGFDFIGPLILGS